MGACLSAPGEDLPPATEDDLSALRDRGHLPCVGTPSFDITEKNHCHTVYFASYENGTELTLLFHDEDRISAIEDCTYDTIRRPLFGRWSDIETFFVIEDKVEFPGTYGADHKWTDKLPKHAVSSVDLSDFEKKDGTDVVVWVNTWNHLFGERNNNTDVDVSFQRACLVGQKKAENDADFVLRKGSRAEVDAMFRGCITSVSEVLTEERAKRLGKRLV